MPGITPPSPVACLIIDPEYAHLLTPKRAKKFRARTIEVANHLRKRGIQIIWVTMRDEHEHGLFNCYIKHELPEGALDEHQRAAVSPEKNDLIFIKGDDSAFANSRETHPHSPNANLATILKEMGTHSLVVLGMNTGSCVAKSIEGALENGFNVYAVTNRLADCNCPEWEEKRGGCHNFHEEYLADKLDLHKKQGQNFSLDNLEYILSQDLLNDAKLDRIKKAAQLPKAASKKTYHMPIQRSPRPIQKQPLRRPNGPLPGQRHRPPQPAV